MTAVIRPIVMLMVLVAATAALGAQVWQDAAFRAAAVDTLRMAAGAVVGLAVAAVVAAIAKVGAHERD